MLSQSVSKLTRILSCLLTSDRVTSKFQVLTNLFISDKMFGSEINKLNLVCISSFLCLSCLWTSDQVTSKLWTVIKYLFQIQNYVTMAIANKTSFDCWPPTEKHQSFKLLLLLFQTYNIFGSEINKLSSS